MNNCMTFPIFHSASCTVSSIFFDDTTCYDKSFEKLEHDYAYILKNHCFCNKRKKEFLAGRYCGKKAIENLLESENASVIEINSDGTPKWPVGIVGTITHTRNLAGAAVGFSKNLQGIGIDYESILSIDRANYLKDSILTKKESTYFLKNEKMSFNVLCTAIFSAKESVFKCVYPLIREYFEADKIDILELDVLANCFKFRFSDELQNITNDFEFAGYWCCVNDKYICTLVEMRKIKRAFY